MLLPISCPGIVPQPRQPWRLSAATSFLTRADIVDKGVGCAGIEDRKRPYVPSETILLPVVAQS
jgi:hypothetical protein